MGTVFASYRLVTPAGEGAEERTRQKRERAEGRANILVEFEKYGLKVLVGGNLGKPCCICALRNDGLGRSSITIE